MFGLIVICMLSAMLTQQTAGLQRTLNRKLTEPAYEILGENNHIYDSYENDRVDDYKTQDIKDRNDSEDYDGKDSRRLFEWFSRLFKTTTPKAKQVKETTTESSYHRELEERIFMKALHRNLTDVLHKLSEVQKRVTLAMEEKEAYAIITKGKPQIRGIDNGFNHRVRLKREVSETEIDSIKPTNETGNTEPIQLSVNTTERPCDNNITNGRRFGSAVTPTEVKNKLLMYLQESFQEIKSKIMLLKNLKQSFSDNISFKIGYILANIDNLEVSIVNLKNNMEKNKHLWDDNKILDMYDKLKVSNQAVSGLIESLKMYFDKLSNQPQV